MKRRRFEIRKLYRDGIVLHQLVNLKMTEFYYDYLD